MENLTKAAHWLKKIARYYGVSFQCNVCGMRLRRFVPFPKSIIEKARLAGFQYDFEKIETLNYPNYSCPFCECADRERLYRLYLDKLESSGKSLKVLDFAPNRSFSKSMRSSLGYRYQSADLYRTDCDLQLDICNMNKVEDCQFDIIICSHILEHVEKPVIALQEISRVLKRDGFAIIMVPLFTEVTVTIEGNASENEFVRLGKYGQSDHVRLFSRIDFIGQLREAFNVKQQGIEWLEEEEIRQYAIAENSVLYTCYKK